GPRPDSERLRITPEDAHPARSPDGRRQRSDKPVQGGLDLRSVNGRRWLSVVTSGDDFAAGPRDQAGEDPDVDARHQETDRAVRHQDVGPARVKAVDLPLVGAVEGTKRSQFLESVP